MDYPFPIHRIDEIENSRNPAFHDYLSRELSPRLTTEVRSLDRKVQAQEISCDIREEFREAARRLIRTGEASLEFLRRAPITQTQTQQLTEYFLEILRSRTGLGSKG